MERLSYGERALIGLLLAFAAGLAWLYVIRDMGGQLHVGLPRGRKPVWSGGSVLSLAGMWISMMVAMMLPSAAPMLLVFAGIARSGRRASFILGTALCAVGYLLVWSVFSLAAAAGQLVLQMGGFLTPRMELISSVLGGAVFVAAGVYQVTPVKYACLRRCQSPFAFFIERWREGFAGAFEMGVQHGLFCVGCCWVLMLLLFAVGVMDVFWCIAITILVLIEKLIPNRLVAFSAGGGFLAYGVWMMLQAAP